MDLDRQEAVRDREPGHSLAAKETTTELTCPRCNKKMGRYNFGRYSGVVVDSCRKHGIWLDRGELRHIVDFLAERGADGASGPILRMRGSSEEDFTIMPADSLLDGILDLFLRTLRGRVRY